MFYYHTTKITPLQKIYPKDRKAIRNAIEAAENSCFESSRRMGSYILYQGRWEKVREPT